MPSLLVRLQFNSRYCCGCRLIREPELLVDMVDVVLKDSGIEEKFLGITLFALVPNTTEFMNAISFALNGNISLRYFLAYLSPSHLTFACDPSSPVLRSALPTPCRSVCSRFLPWLRSPLGMRPTKWARSQMHSRAYQTYALDVVGVKYIYPYIYLGSYSRAGMSSQSSCPSF
jgi:hypothetical protein